MYDFVCDKTVVDEGKPLSVLEYPAYTYTGKLKEFSLFFLRYSTSLNCNCTVRWPTSYACPVKRAQGNCALPQFDAKWDVSHRCLLAQ